MFELGTGAANMQPSSNIELTAPSFASNWFSRHLYLLLILFVVLHAKHRLQYNVYNEFEWKKTRLCVCAVFISERKSSTIYNGGINRFCWHDLNLKFIKIPVKNMAIGVKLAQTKKKEFIKYTGAVVAATNVSNFISNILTDCCRKHSENLNDDWQVTCAFMQHSLCLLQKIYYYIQKYLVRERQKEMESANERFIHFWCNFHSSKA